jgi:hypothetical protein
VNDRLLPGDMAARGRFSTLVEAIGGEPAGGYHRAVLARLASWTDNGDVNALAFMIRQAIEPYRSLVTELVPIIRRSRETSDSGALIIAVPQELARQLALISTEEDKQ